MSESSNQSSSLFDSTYLSSPTMSINQSIVSIAASVEKKKKEGTETPVKKTNKNKRTVKVNTSRSNVDTNDSSSQLDSPYLSTSKSMRINQSTASNVTSTDKKEKNDKNHTEELERQMLSLNVSETLSTPAREVGRSDAEQQKSDGKELEMSETISDQYTTEAMESDVTNFSDEFKTKRRRKKGKIQGKQKVPVDQPHRSLPKYSSTPAKETKDDNAGNWTSRFKRESNTLPATNLDYQRSGEKPAPQDIRKDADIETNHFPIKFKNLPAFFYHYTVMFNLKDDKRFNRRLLQEFIKVHCGNRTTAFDGVSILYSTLELFPEKEKSAEITLELRNQPVNFNIYVKFNNAISTEPLKNLS